jgi:uncharacterized protein
VPHLSLVTLAVADVSRATAFYTALGWQASPASVPGEVTFFPSGGAVLALWGRDDLARDAGTGIGAHPASALAMNVAAPEAVDATLAAAASAGGTVTRPAAATSWGGWTGYFTDLDGHLWEVAHNPAFTLLDDGRVVLPDA